MWPLPPTRLAPCSGAELEAAPRTLIAPKLKVSARGASAFPDGFQLGHHGHEPGAYNRPATNPTDQMAEVARSLTCRQLCWMPISLCR